MGLVVGLLPAAFFCQARARGWGDGCIVSRQKERFTVGGELVLLIKNIIAEFLFVTGIIS